MENIFLKILNISITASWLVLAVLLMRLVLKKAPKWLSVIMWALVGIRLVLPFSFESIFSLIPSTETVPPEILYEQAPQIHTGFDVINSAVNPVISESFAPAPGASVNPLQVITYLAGWIWIIGMVAMAGYTLISCLRIRRKLREAAPLQDNIYLCDRIDTPFIFGLFRPRIYLPSAMIGADIPFVLAHEKAHLKRKDHLWKPLGFLLLTVYWFNPLLWLAYILLCRDIEAACDEKVLTDMGEEIKKPYSQALVNCSVPRKMIAACPLAFGEVNVKSRIRKVLSYKKPAFWLLIAAVIVCIVLSVCFLTNPRTVNEQMQVFLDCTIADHFQTDKSQGNACCLDYQVLGTEKKGKETTVYLWVLYEEYSWGSRSLVQETGTHIPTVITATKESGGYRLVEYWEPRDGSYYSEDIKAKFPMRLWSKALDSQRYIDRQKKACREMAERYFKENPAYWIYSSSPSHDLGVLKDQLTSERHAILEYARSLIDSYTFDIDKDGKNELCELYYGPTSGIFTFILAVYEDEVIEYCNIYTTNHGDVSFDKQADGNIGILYAPYLDEANFGFFDLQIVDGHVRLFRDGAQVEYWGPQNENPYALETLRWRYPHYFDLPTDKGLQVCGCQMTDGSYRWGLMSGANTEYELTAASLEEICAIVASYNLDDSQIVVRPLFFALSSQRPEIDNANLEKIEKMFWDAYNSATSSSATCERVVLSYHGNPLNTLLIGDPQVCSYLLQQVRQAYANRQQGESTKGYAGATFSLKLYLSDGSNPIEISLWNDSTFSMRAFYDSEGYPYFFHADISALYAYLEENYPADFWDGNHVQSTVSYAGGSGSELAAITEEALNPKELTVSSVMHLPVLKFDTLAELEAFKTRYPSALDVSWDEVPSFNTVTAQYSDAFFENNTLVLVYVDSGNCTYRYDVFNVFYGRDAFMVRVYETTGAEIVEDAEAHWFITVAIPDVTADKITTFDAVLNDTGSGSSSYREDKQRLEDELQELQQDYAALNGD